MSAPWVLDKGVIHPLRVYKIVFHTLCISPSCLLQHQSPCFPNIPMTIHNPIWLIPSIAHIYFFQNPDRQLVWIIYNKPILIIPCGGPSFCTFGFPMHALALLPSLLEPPTHFPCYLLTGLELSWVCSAKKKIIMIVRRMLTEFTTK